jgi:predicted AlkP superfamily phosphohydrolase/phosphomutase
MLIGLDYADPSLVLERWRDELPTLSGLTVRGAYGRLTSVIPAITVPAWSCMMASKTPGDLGVYGFRNRSDRARRAGSRSSLIQRGQRSASGSRGRTVARSSSTSRAPGR